MKKQTQKTQPSQPAIQPSNQLKKIEPKKIHAKPLDDGDDDDDDDDDQPTQPQPQPIQPPPQPQPELWGGTASCQAIMANGQVKTFTCAVGFTYSDSAIAENALAASLTAQVSLAGGKPQGSINFNVTYHF